MLGEGPRNTSKSFAYSFNICYHVIDEPALLQEIQKQAGD
jgi:hypothetical protein